MYTRCVAVILICLAFTGPVYGETSIEVRFGENPPHLYLLRDGEIEVVYPVAVARPNIKFRLPVEGRATQIQMHAPWYPTLLSRRMYAAQHGGKELPAMVPYGDPRNQMGVGKIFLTFPRGWYHEPLRIHGTIEPDSIGKRVSGGCIRMFDEDFIDLARRLKRTKLPIKVHWRE